MKYFNSGLTYTYCTSGLENSKFTLKTLHLHWTINGLYLMWMNGEPCPSSLQHPANIYLFKVNNKALEKVFAEQVNVSWAGIYLFIVNIKDTKLMSDFEKVNTNWRLILKMIIMYQSKPLDGIFYELRLFSYN